MNKNRFAICVVTYSKRFELFKKTLHDIRAQTDIDVYVAINGDYATDFDENYRKEVLAECMKYDSVYPSFYLKFRGLSKLWNDCIVNCCAEHIILSNDDVVIKDGFFPEFIDFIHKSPQTLLTVNKSFSTFYINKNYADVTGYFNETFLGIGWEDTEFTRRTNSGKHFMTFTTDKYENLSYFNNDLKDQGAALTLVKYHTFNEYMFKTQKIEKMENYRPYERFYMDNYDTFWESTEFQATYTWSHKSYFMYLFGLIKFKSISKLKSLLK
jgi:GT2 family glycosyltransferase